MDRRTVRVLFTILVFAAVLAVVYLARRTFFAFLLAIFFAYLLEPVIARAHAWLGGSRIRAIGITYLTLLVAFAIAIVFAVPRLVAEGQRAAEVVPTFFQKVGNGQIVWQVGDQHGWSYRTKAELEHWLVTHREEIVGGAQGFAARAAEIGANAGWFLLVPIFAFFFLKDKSCMADALLGLTDDGTQRAFVRNVLDDLDRMLAQYIRAQLLLALCAAVAYTVFLLVVRFPYALVLGILAGVLEFIPFVGPLITAVALASIGFLSGYEHWLLVLAFVGVWRLIQDYVNTPYIMGEGLELHPLAAIFGILVGGEVAGIPGMFLSIPVIAGLRIIWNNWQLHGALNQSSVISHQSSVSVASRQS